MAADFQAASCIFKLFGVLCGLFAIVPAFGGENVRWIGSWYSPSIELSSSFSNATVKTVVKLTAGGNRLRIRYSNQYGSTPLQIGGVRVLTAEGISRRVTFSGKSQLVLAPGAFGMSDPVGIKTAFGTDLAVFTYYPKRIPDEITHQSGVAESNTLIKGDAVSVPNPSHSGKPLSTTYFLTGVDVEDSDLRGTIVVVADSMTGNGSGSWPALLAGRLNQSGKKYGVLNAAIGGNRILTASAAPYGGPSVLSRFDRDVLSQPGVKYLIIYEGVNDIEMIDSAHFGRNEALTVTTLADGISSLAAKARDRGIKVYVATLAPLGGMPPAARSTRKDEMRRALNSWIRTSKDFDGYFDFDRVLEDPDAPDPVSGLSRLKPEYDFAAHPNDAGQRALSESIDLSMFD